MSFVNQIRTFFKGKDLTHLWEQFAHEKNGVLKYNSGDVSVAYSYENFTCTIENYTHYVTVGLHTHTKKYMIGMVEFFHPTQFELCITKEDLFTRVGKMFKNQKVSINYKNFDNQFYVKSNFDFKAMSILKDQLLVEKIISLQPTRIEITNQEGLFGKIPGNGKHMLYYVKQENFKNIEQCYQIDLLLKTFIDNLKRYGSIH
jgi:hypothetical protein